MVSFSISYWDLIKFPYFADTTERGDRRWKQAQRQGDVTTHTIVREKNFQASSIMKEKSYNSRICHPFPKQKTLIFTHKIEGPVWASLWIDCSVCSWCLGKRPILCLLVLGNWSSHPLSRHLETQNNLSRLGPSLISSKESHAMSKFTYAWGGSSSTVPNAEPKMYEAFKFQGKLNAWICCFAQPPNSCWILKLMLGSFKFDMKFKLVLGEYWILLITAVDCWFQYFRNFSNHRSTQFQFCEEN